MNFDLNIDNYSRDELIEMFELPQNFDKNIVEIKESKLKDSIINNGEINKETQLQTVNFLLKAKNIILNDTQKNNSDGNILLNTLSKFYNSNGNLKQTTLVDKTEHMIQENDRPPYLQSYPSEFFPGIINPIKKKIIKKVLNVDSRFRDNYYSTSSTNYNVSLPTNFNDVLEMQLLSIEIPQTYHIISKQYSNNFFTVVVNGHSQVVTIPDGNYGPLTITTIINQELTNLGGDFACVVFTCNYINNNNNVPTGTGQILVGFNGSQSQGLNATLELNFQADILGLDDRFTPLPLKFGWILGFRNGIYINNQNYVSEGSLNFAGPRYFYLVIDDYNNNVVNNFYGAFNSSVLNKNILARISSQISSNSYSLMEQNNIRNISPAREYMGPVNLTNLTIQLLDEFGRVINLNNMDFSFSLQLTMVYNI